MTSPAPPLNIPNAVQLTVDLSQTGQVAQCVVGYARTDQNAFLNAADAQALLNHFWASFRTLVVQTTSCTGGRVRVAAPDGVALECVAPPTPAGDSFSSTTLANGSSLIKWTTGKGGRSGKGRTYVPGLPGNGVGTDGRTYTPAHRTLAQNAVAAFLVPPTTSAGYVPAVLSRVDGVASPILAGALSNVIGTQRRRMR